MKPLSFMVIAGEPSGDLLASELVDALRQEIARSPTPAEPDPKPWHTALAPRFFGAGGSRMAESGVELAIDLTHSTVFGVAGVVRYYLKFVRFRNTLLRMAIERQPDVIIGVDYSGFNRSLAAAVRRSERRQPDPFGNWHPKLVQFVSPQVWASRPGRVHQMQRDYDLILSIIPFEKAWYARHAPKLQVEFVGNPIFDRHPPRSPDAAKEFSDPPVVALLPGSRRSELKHHLPIILEAADRIHAAKPCRFSMVLPNEHLAALARSLAPGRLMDADASPTPGAIQCVIGNLASALAQADVAIASSGTVTLECAWFGVPAVVLYKVSQIEFELAIRIVNVPFAAMPNLLLGERVFPEFLQQAATPTRIAEAVMRFLNEAALRTETRRKLNRVIASLGTPGATQRAAQAVLSLLDTDPASASAGARSRRHTKRA